MNNGKIGLNNEKYVEVGRKIVAASEEFCQYLYSKAKTPEDLSSEHRFGTIIEQIKQSVEKEVE